jgi:magnesium-transporting ATPase (P-type)
MIILELNIFFLLWYSKLKLKLMTDFNQNVNEAKDMLNLEEKDMKKLPQMLNVLTILTYIGCAFALISSIWGYFSASMNYEAYQKLDSLTSGTGNSGFDKLMSGATEVVKKQYDNRLIILLLGIVGVALCFYGAMQMRNLKKQGYMIYLVGEVLPIISFAAFIGFGNIVAALSMFFIVLFSILFIILYTTQRKNLVN